MNDSGKPSGQVAEDEVRCFTAIAIEPEIRSSVLLRYNGEECEQTERDYQQRSCLTGSDILSFLRPIALGAAGRSGGRETGETRTAIPALRSAAAAARLTRSRIKSPAENEKLDPAAMQCRIGRERRPISISLSLSLSKCPTAKAPPGILNKRRERSRFVFLSMNGIRQRVPKAEKCGNSEGGERTTDGGETSTETRARRTTEQRPDSLALLSSSIDTCGNCDKRRRARTEQDLERKGSVFAHQKRKNRIAGHRTIQPSPIKRNVRR